MTRYHKLSLTIEHFLHFLIEEELLLVDCIIEITVFCPVFERVSNFLQASSHHEGSEKGLNLDNILYSFRQLCPLPAIATAYAANAELE